MAEAHEPEATALERELLWNAVEGTYLIEIRNDAGTASSVDEYRAAAGAALEKLVHAGLISVSAGPWGGDQTVPVDADTVRRRLLDGSAWDTERDDLLVIDATPEGRGTVGA